MIIAKESNKIDWLWIYNIYARNLDHGGRSAARSFVMEKYGVKTVYDYEDEFMSKDYNGNFYVTYIQFHIVDKDKFMRAKLSRCI